MKLATVFSGIGAIEQATKKVYGEDKLDIVFACDTGERYLDLDKEEIDTLTKDMKYEEKQSFIKELYLKHGKTNYVKKSYFANYHINEEQWYEDIRFIDGTRYKGQVDLFVGGSPCQSFSIIGKRAGLDDARGTLFYDFARLVKEIQPQVFIYENVTGMLSHDKGNTWQVIKDIFESLNYEVSSDVLNSKDFGIPQDRKRLFVVGFKDKSVKFNFPTPIPNSGLFKKTMFDYLEGKVAYNFYLGKKGFEFVTNPKYKNRARVNKEVIQTQKANQQFNWNGDFVFEELDTNIHDEKVLERAHIGEFEGKRGVIRQLSHRECLRLMGFPDDFKITVPNVQLYRQAGNSIVVDVLEKILIEIKKALGDDFGQ